MCVIAPHMGKCEISLPRKTFGKLDDLTLIIYKLHQDETNLVRGYQGLAKEYKEYPEYMYTCPC